MIDRNTARATALTEINKPSLYGAKPDCVILDEHTREGDFGWVFFYQSRAYVETGEFSHKLAGNAPLIVNRMNGSVWVTGTAHPVEHYIAAYRERLAHDSLKTD